MGNNLLSYLSFKDSFYFVMAKESYSKQKLFNRDNSLMYYNLTVLLFEKLN